MVAPLTGAATRAHLRRATRAETNGLTPPRAGQPVVWAAAKGANVLDLEGNRYLDVTSGFGVAAIGHRHPEVVAAVRRQAGRLIHGLGDAHAHPWRSELAQRLAAKVPITAARVAFAVSGADAVELAIKTALLATGRNHLLAFVPSYHGLTLGALAVTSRRAFRQVVDPYLHSEVSVLPYGCPLSRIEATLRRRKVAAIIVEPIVGREGVLVPPAGWLAGLAEACRRHGALFIADEVLTGCGRTGRWFAVQHDGAEPDVICCGKALGGGLPIAAVAGRGALMEAWNEPGEARHTATFVANPLACAAALASLRVLERDRLVARAAALGKVIGRALAQWSARYSFVDEVRGRGGLWGIEFADRQTAAEFVGRSRRHGLLMLAGGPEGRVAQLSPPLVITDRQLACALDILSAVAGELSAVE